MMRAQQLPDGNIRLELSAGEKLAHLDGPTIVEGLVPQAGLIVWDALVAADIPIEPAPPAIPASISDRQFAQALALDGVISKAEALAWAARGDLPQKLKDALTEIPEAGGQRFGAEMMLSAATLYERGHPLVPTLGALLGYDESKLDDLWTRGAAL